MRRGNEQSEAIGTAVPGQNPPLSAKKEAIPEGIASFFVLLSIIYSLLSKTLPFKNRQALS